MSDLLEVAVSAHGGLDRWDSVTSIDVAASLLIAIDMVEITMRRPAANHV